MTFHERPPDSGDTSESEAVTAPDEPGQAIALPGTSDGADSGTGEPAAAVPADAGDDKATTESGYVVIE